MVQLDHTSLLLSGKRSTVFLPSSYYCYLPPTSLKRLPFWTKTGLSVIPYTGVLPPAEPAELNNVLRFVSLILSLISPKSSWQGSCQAISGNKNSLHTALLIFPLLCLLLKCFLPPSLEEQHCNYWKLALPAACLQDQRVLLMFQRGGGRRAREAPPSLLSSRSELVDCFILSGS